MPAVLAPPDPLDTERIMVYGAAGVGKTTSYLSILKRTAGRGFILDTDATVVRSTSSERFLPLRDKIEVCTPVDMAEAIEKAETYRGKATAEDWQILDRVDWLWEAAQEEFSNEVWGRDADEHFLLFRKAAEASDKNTSKSPFDGMQDWPTIKKRHNRVMRVLMTWPGHVFVVAAEKELIRGMESTQTQRDYGTVGFKPAGEKFVSHLTHTVIRMQGNNPSTWRMTTVKDRERTQLDGTGVSDTVAVVTRWFGGVLLGAGGLVRAYGDAVRAGLDDAGVRRRVLMSRFDLAASHADAARWEADLRARDVTVLGADYAERVVLHLAVPSASAGDLAPLVASMTGGAAELVPVGKDWVDAGG